MTALGRSLDEFDKDQPAADPAGDRAAYLEGSLWPPVLWTLTKPAWIVALAPAIFFWLLDQLWLKRRKR